LWHALGAHPGACGAAGTAQRSVQLHTAEHENARRRRAARAAATAPPPAVAPAAAAESDFLDDAHKLEPWLAAEAQQARWSALGLEETRAASFASAHEFVSLGCFCGVSRSLQALGLKRYAYPFDWVRCPVEGIIHCLEARFEDFLTFTASCQPPYVKQKVFTTSRWGGSFWHHDPMAPGTADVFLRRAERFLGLREVSASQARIFVWAVNATRELNAVPRLFDALQRALPQAKIRLLVLVDLQRSQGPICLSGASCNSVLFYLMHEDIFGPARGPASQQWRPQLQLPHPQQLQQQHQQPSQQKGSGWSMQRHSEAYAEAVAYAVKHWAGQEGTLEVLRVVPNLASLVLLCGQWDGGSPSNELFYPRPLMGPRLHIKPSLPMQVPQHPLPCAVRYPQPLGMPLLNTRASSAGRSDSARRSPPTPSRRSNSPPGARWVPATAPAQLGVPDQSMSSALAADSLPSARREEQAAPTLPLAAAASMALAQRRRSDAPLGAAEQRLSVSEQRVAQLKQEIARVRNIFKPEPQS